MIEYFFEFWAWSLGGLCIGFVLGSMQRRIGIIETEVHHVEHDVTDIKKKVQDA